MRKKLNNSVVCQWIGVVILGLVLVVPLAYAEKVKKPHLPKSYDSKVAPPEINDTDRMFIDLREAAKKTMFFGRNN